ncbi:hypothetical protein ACIRJR_36040, partial [Streptomyces sp. NPDC102402]|uniref:hypothetical protein n=1 Tax=Streptomyces sp. NPDC102402 TaxID=3366169 RepID=UPI00382B2898
PPAHPATKSAHPPPDHSHTINEPAPKAFRINNLRSASAGCKRLTDCELFISLTGGMAKTETVGRITAMPIRGVVTMAAQFMNAKQTAEYLNVSLT